jgi:hypothetical protein
MLGRSCPPSRQERAQRRLSRTATVAAWTRFVTPNFAKRLLVCGVTVRRLRKRASAISRSVLPATSKRRTSTSRRLSACRASGFCRGTFGTSVAAVNAPIWESTSFHAMLRSVSHSAANAGSPIRVRISALTWADASVCSVCWGILPPLPVSGRHVPAAQP